MELERRKHYKGVLHSLSHQPLRGKSRRATRNRYLLATGTGMAGLAGYLALRTHPGARALFHPTGYRAVPHYGTGFLPTTRTGRVIRTWTHERPVNPSELSLFRIPGVGKKVAQRILAPTTYGRANYAPRMVAGRYGSTERVGATRIGRTGYMGGTLETKKTWPERRMIKINTRNFPFTFQGERYFSQSTRTRGKVPGAKRIFKMNPGDRIFEFKHKGVVTARWLIRDLKMIPEGPLMVQSIPYVTRKAMPVHYAASKKIGKLLEGQSGEQVKNPVWRIPGLRKGLEALNRYTGRKVQNFASKMVERMALPRIPKKAFHPTKVKVNGREMTVPSKIQQVEKKYLRGHRLAVRDIYRENLRAAEELHGEKPGFVNITRQGQMLKRTGVPGKTSKPWFGSLGRDIAVATSMQQQIARRAETAAQIHAAAQAATKDHIRQIALDELGKQYPSFTMRMARRIVKPFAVRAERTATSTRNRILGFGRGIGLDVPTEVKVRHGPRRGTTTLPQGPDSGFREGPFEPATASEITQYYAAEAAKRQRKLDLERKARIRDLARNLAITNVKKRQKKAA